jgi:redox-sensitive bicupin YhaK (pirin superfamily)
MAAITADTLTLPRVKSAGLGDVERPVLAVSTAPAGFEGEGFPVRRALAGVNYQHLDPFIMMDQMGEVDYPAGEPKGTNWHPHRGFETVTYLIEGQFIHQDTHGGGGVITEGSTQWMTAGAGLLHIETPPEKLVEDGGLFHATVHPGQRLSLPWQPTYNGLVYVMAGSGSVGDEGQPIHAGQLAVMGAGDRITVTADAKQDGRTAALEVILLGGEPIREPMAHYGPFVMNTRAELQQTLEDYQAGRLGIIPPDAIMPHVPSGQRSPLES